MSYPLCRAVFLDRDGVINRKAPDGDYIRNWQQIEFIPGAIEAIARLSSSGVILFVVTNQRGIARRMVTLSDVNEIHRLMQETISNAGGRVAQIYYCPHDYSDNCDCRKPKPGMLIRAATEHGVSLESSWMVGDSESDVQAGKSVGCKTLRVVDAEPIASTVEPDAYVRDLSSAVGLILDDSNSSPGAVRKLSKAPF
jgi:D-glycero-D-manno-heptose 1,7-bisphosphate phosphatase